MNFYQSHSTQCDITVAHQIGETELCHGWAGWFTMQLGDNWLSTAPHEPLLHWSSAFLPLDPPLKMQQGTEVTFRLQRPPSGDWSWRVTTETRTQQHSTFFSLPLSLKAIQQRSPEYLPKLGSRGQAALYVLSHSDGSYTVQQLSEQVVKEYPDLFPRLEQALNFVRSLTLSLA